MEMAIGSQSHTCIITPTLSAYRLLKNLFDYSVQIMVTDGSKHQASAAPPHKLVVLKFVESRASELESLHSVVANSLNNDFRCQRNKRRRTTGHDDRVGRNRFRKKQRVGIKEMNKSDSSKKDEKKVSRRLRRRIELSKNPESGFCTSGDGMKRLRTHVWHAKRFTMRKLGGFHIPLGLHGRGRGTRALLKKLKRGVLVHDMSYCGAVQLEGPEDILLSVLSFVLVSSPSTHFEDRLHNILSGNISGSAMLHHAGKPFSPTIAPVTYLWRPLTQIGVNRKVHKASLCDEKQSIDGDPFRQLWVWIHSAAFREGYDALRSACERHMDVIGHSLKCTLCDGQLGNLELIGSNAFQLLGKILQPASCISESSWHLKKCSADEDEEESKKTSILQNEEQISSSAIIFLIVNGPRTSSRKAIETVSEEKVPGLLGKNKEQTGLESDAQWLLFSPNNENHSVAEHIDLWDASGGICPPVEENVICMEKNHRHQKLTENFSYLSIHCNHTLNRNNLENGNFKYHRIQQFKNPIGGPSVSLPLALFGEARSQLRGLYVRQPYSLGSERNNGRHCLLGRGRTRSMFL